MFFYNDGDSPMRMISIFNQWRQRFRRVSKPLLELSAIGSGAVAMVWFLVRVIPKPSRASYPCQRAAFPVASAFVLWLAGALTGKFAMDSLRRRFRRYRWAVACLGAATVLGISAWTFSFFSARAEANPTQIATDFNFIPAKPNDPKGMARGVNPGRVVWTRDPLATKWSGHWREATDQWWLDSNTDQARVDAMLSTTLLELTSATTGEQAWQRIFQYYNQNARQMENRGYQPGEVVAVKINLNNCTGSNKKDNYTDASPQAVLAMVRELVKYAHVRQEDILVYDGRRYIAPLVLTKIWNEFKDVRFVQEQAAKDDQPKNPGYGDYHGLEQSNWVEGIAYSNGRYDKAKLIPKQVYDATYSINFAILKAHSYPYNTMESGDEGQTGITMCGKNHFGSIKGTPELHSTIDTDKEAVKDAYSPIVDLAASPNLGAKTILYVLDGLYCGRKWRTYPIHFPNPPFNNRVTPYENPDWPASILASMDGVALDSVGLDILFAQTKNNIGEDGHSRILVRANADDYLFEMAEADHPPSGTVYAQNGKRLNSLGVHERWDGDATMRYSRNLDPVNGKGIELMYIPVAAPAGAASLTPPPAVLPGNGLAEHDFFYAGEAKDRRMFIVKNGKIVWSYDNPEGKGEISDAVLLSSGNILFAHQFGVTLLTPDKKVVWNYDAPSGNEIHTAQPIGNEHVLFIQNGNPALLKVVNIVTGQTTKEFPLSVTGPTHVHGQFRHARLTPSGTLLVAHMDSGKVSEYDESGKEMNSYPAQTPWGVEPLKNGNLLITDKIGVRELTKNGEVVWECTRADIHDYKIASLQLAWRLPNGNTLVNNWTNPWQGKVDINEAPVQALELTPDKKVVWALRSWTDPVNLGPATTIQLLDSSKAPEDVAFGEIK